jgi:hypothetical protein
MISGVMERKTTGIIEAPDWYVVTIYKNNHQDTLAYLPAAGLRPGLRALWIVFLLVTGVSI